MNRADDRHEQNVDLTVWQKWYLDVCKQWCAQIHWPWWLNMMNCVMRWKCFYSAKTWQVQTFEGMNRLLKRWAVVMNSRVHINFDGWTRGLMRQWRGWAAEVKWAAVSKWTRNWWATDLQQQRWAVLDNLAILKNRCVAAAVLTSSRLKRQVMK